MTTKAHETHINLTKWVDHEQFRAYMVDIVTAWERGRIASESGATISPEAWQQISRRTYEFAGYVSKAVLEEAAPQISAAGAASAAGTAFNEGFAKGQASAAGSPSGKRPALPAASSGLDSEAIMKTIGEELRKMFETGFEHGKIDRPQPPRVVSAINKVQRSLSGDITQAVTTYQYEDAPGVQPPPL